MQPPRPPPAAVDALVAGSGRCALRWQCPPPRARRQRTPYDPPAAPAAHTPLAMCAASASAGTPIVSCSVGSIFASLWHAQGTVPASPKHESDERTLCGRLLDTPCIAGRVSYVPQIAGRDSDTANVFGRDSDAQEPPNVQMSPDNKFIVQMSPENEAVSESRPKRRRRQDIVPKTPTASKSRPKNARPVRMPREALHSRPYTRPKASNAVATPSSHTGSVT